MNDSVTVARIVLGADVTSAPYWVTLYIAVGLLYFAVAFALSRLANRWERSRPSSDLVQTLAVP